MSADRPDPPAFTSTPATEPDPAPSTADGASLPVWLRPRIAEVLGPLDDADWTALAASATVVDLPAGTPLFAAGDPADDWYVVLSGRLAVLAPAQPGDVARRLADAGAGEVIGELAVLTGRQRSASVHAVRDSRLLRLGPQVMHGPMLRTPERAAALLRHLALRMAERSSAVAAPVAGACVVLLPATPRVDAAGFAQGLCRALQPWGRSVVLDAHSGPAAGLPPAAHSEAARQAWMRVDAALDTLANDTEHLLLLADAHPSDWTRHALQHADHVLVVADAEAEPAPLAHEAEWLARRATQAAPPEATLVLLQPADRALPHGTAAWLDARPGLAHRHFARATPEASWARIARHVTGRSWALALSGGGARCFAQLGVVQALGELGWPVDGLSGTSGGAMSAGLIAQGLSATQLRHAARGFHEARPFRRGTLPLYSLRSGAPLDAALRAGSHTLQIEDLWLPLVLVSSNLTQARPQWHRRGPLFDAVRASASLPGIVPPWVSGGDLLVDGGLVDNLPVDVARQCIAPQVLAVDVAEDTAARFEGALHYPSPWRRLADTALGRHSPQPPGLLAILMQSLLLGSLAQTRRQREAATVCLRPPLVGFGMMATGRWAEIIDAGYREAMRVLPPVQARHLG